MILANDTMIPIITCLIHRRPCRVPRSKIFLVPLPLISADAVVRFSLGEEGSFNFQLRGATVDMAPDEGVEARAQKASQLRWDRKRKRFTRVPSNGEGNEKMIRSESGALLPATFKSGRYEQWRRAERSTPASREFTVSCFPHLRHVVSPLTSKTGISWREVVADA